MLGYGSTTNVGDNETPASAGDISVGGTVTQIDAGNGEAHTCARLDSGGVRCWGWGIYGQLGYGNTEDIGDDETPSSVDVVMLGGSAVNIAVGQYHTCATLDGGAVRCWGVNESGQLGYGNTDTIGDDEAPRFAGDVSLGARAIAAAAGRDHTCALLETGAVRCWGRSAYGQLGYGNTVTIGDDELPASAGDVPSH